MLVFIDESGDPGFKVAKGSGSTPVFAAAMVVFADHDEAARTENLIRSAPTDFHRRPEFKFNKTSFEVRDRFFGMIRNCSFVVRAIVVRKALIWSTLLRSDDRAFYRFFIKSMVKFDNRLLQGATVIIGGSGDRDFRLQLQRCLRGFTNEGAISKVKMRDSRGEPLLQLADMCVGAIARSYRTDRSDADRWRKQLGTKIRQQMQHELDNLDSIYIRPIRLGRGRVAGGIQRQPAGSGSLGRESSRAINGFT